MTVQIIHGDCRSILATLPAEMVQCCVTSPPYYGLRDYGTATWEGGDASCDHRSPTMRDGRNENRAKLAGSEATNAAQLLLAHRSACGKCGAVKVDQQIGLEPSPQEYVDELVAVFREVRRVLRQNGTLWLNLGDSYASDTKGSGGVGKSGLMNDGRKDSGRGSADAANGRAKFTERRFNHGLKTKDLMLIPARVALALQADGWWLRSEIIWSKAAPMPESVRDRPTCTHEKVWLLTKAANYFYDADAVAEPCASIDPEHSSYRPNSVKIAAEGRKTFSAKNAESMRSYAETRNLRNVWHLAAQPFPGAHFATMPPTLAERCIKAGSRPGDTVLDPFAGAGTTLLVADRLQRHGIGIELNPEYAAMAERRVHDDAPLLTELSACA